KEQVLKAFTGRYVLHRLEQTGGNITRAAEMSGMLRPNFKKLMKRFEIETHESPEVDSDGAG
ncbi:MAG: helix-turn-helix domain-containing protein, partial [Myxococcota bacterium]|nr:helix-turn-helix domain-containing protein [Myxococcota bacterium]